MAEPYIGEIRIFAGNYSPRQWAKCDGQLMAISSNDALFALIGTTYGGDGRTTFALPDLRGRIPLHVGSGSGLNPVVMGQKIGLEQVTLSTNNLPSHNHPMQASNITATSTTPVGNLPAQGQFNIYDDGQGEPLNSVQYNQSAVGTTGGSLGHSNMQPYLGLTFIISLSGLFPPRN